VEIIRAIGAMREVAGRARANGQRIGFVPTMGWLHEGHTSLIGLARERTDLVVVSIFVNPTQFGPEEDFERYPRDLERDAVLAREAGCDVLFVPDGGEMYPEGYATYVYVEGLSDLLCGERRPGHFRGVATVVAKLLNIVQPQCAVFGQKDAQQSVIIRRMVKDLDMDVEIVIGPTVREKNGVAVSSRNMYLSGDERVQASALYRSLVTAKKMIEAGERDVAAIVAAMRQMIESQPAARVDYISIVDSETLKEVTRLDGEVLIALAVWFGKARLIDNMVFTIENKKGKG